MPVRALLPVLALLVVACGDPGAGGVVPARPGPRAVPGVVVSVADGDTVVVRTPGGGELRVRVLGIDSPERGECGSAEATAFARATLDGREVALVGDPTQDARDRYGRTLAYLELPDGSDFSVLAADAGAARSVSYDGPVARHDAIVAAQERARAAGRGLWACPGP